jgi:predicted DNA-binding protein with PD1-like motif
MHTQTVDAGKMHFIRMDPGEDVLESLRSAVKNHQITSAVIVSGVGSVDKYQAHVVKTPQLPPGNIYFGKDGALDILALTGMVLDGEVHAHITLSDPLHALGGHLEEGCRVLTFAIVAMIDIPKEDFSAWDFVGPLSEAGK